MISVYVMRLYGCSACHVIGKQLKLLSHETVHRNRIKLVATEKASNSQKFLITLYIVGWVIIKTDQTE